MPLCKSCYPERMLFAPRKWMSVHWPCLHKFYLCIRKSGITSIFCFTCFSFFTSCLPNMHINTALSTFKQMVSLTLLFICCLSVFNYVLHRPFFFVTCKIKAIHHKCFIFTVLPAKSCTAKQIKQMADLNVKDRKKSMKKSWNKLEYRIEYIEMWWIRG